MKAFLGTWVVATWFFAGHAFAEGDVIVSSDVRTPLSDAAQEIASAIPNEETPRTELHYFRSNEWRQDLLRPHLEGRGGAYVGVGSDQNYTMAAMARSEVLFLVDFDARIPLVHQIYRALVSESETPDELIGRFSEEGARDAEALIRRSFSDPAVQAKLVRHYRSHREAWHPYLRRVQREVRNGQPSSWLADPDLYAHVRSLHRAGRIISRSGDLTGQQTVRAIGRAARNLGVPVRIVYFSNAEQFFDYTPDFKENMRVLPTDERSIVVRTILQRHFEPAEDAGWHYMIHEFPDFIDRISTGAYVRSFALVADLLSAGAPFHGRETGISTMTQETRRFMLEDLERRRSTRRQ